MKKRYFDLQIFDDGGTGGTGGTGTSGGAGAGNGGQGGNAGSSATTYSYEQAEQIAEARAEHASRVALAKYFEQQGMSQDEITAAIQDYKSKKAASQPNVAAITKERDDARKELETMKNSNYLRDKGVKGEDLDYVLFKVSQKVDDKTDFKKAADVFLKENPKYTSQGGSFRVSSGTADGGSGHTQNVNDTINQSIRNAFGR